MAPMARPERMPARRPIPARIHSRPTSTSPIRICTGTSSSERPDQNRSPSTIITRPSTRTAFWMTSVAIFIMGLGSHAAPLPVPITPPTTAWSAGSSNCYPAGMEIRHSVCALDCPDACALLVHIEDGRATRLRGDPDHPVTRGFLCGKVAQYLEREYSPDRLLYPQKRIGAKGEGRFARISWDEGARHHRPAPGRHRAGARPRVDSALQLRRHHGPAQRLRHGPPLLPSPGRLAPRPHHLFLDRRRRAHRHARPALRHRARTVPPRETDPRLGREHSRHQRAPVALHRGGPAQRGQAVCDRPRPHAHRRAGRPTTSPSTPAAIWRWRSA